MTSLVNHRELSATQLSRKLIIIGSAPTEVESTQSGVKDGRVIPRIVGRLLCQIGVGKDARIRDNGDIAVR